MIGRRAHDDAQSFDDAWAGRAPRDEQIASLVRFAENLCEAAVAEPTPEFRQGLRTQLMTEAATALKPQPKVTRSFSAPTQTHPIRRRAAGLTAAFVASAGVISLVTTSASAVPGEMLYSVKRTVEFVELALQRDEASRGSFQLAQASERLAEARQLSGDGAPDQIAATLDDFTTQAWAGSTALFADFGANGSEESIRKVNDFTAAATVGLSQLSTQLPEEASDSFKVATDTLSDMAIQASSLCTECVSADVQSLVNAVTDLAKKTPNTADADSSESPDKVNTSSPTPSDVATTPKPLIAVPTAPPSGETPTAKDATDPLVGLLLGDDEQTGVVPGLLGGLLGDGE